MILNILKATRASRANEGKSMKASQIDRIRIAQYIFSINIQHSLAAMSTNYR